VTEAVLRGHLHLPLQQVANKFGMCTTAFKKLCRRFGIAKWPHRQLRGIDKKIAALKAELNYSTVDEESARRNLAALEEERARLSRVTIGQTLPGPLSNRGPDLQCGVTLPLSRPMGLEAAAAGASRKRKAETLEPEADKSARSADASALDILASVAGIGASVPLASAAPMQRSQTTHSDSSTAPALAQPVLPDAGGRQLAALHVASFSTASSSSSSISTPSLAPISPAMGHRAPQLVSPTLCPTPMGEASAAHGARGGFGFGATSSAAPLLDLGMLISILGAQT